MIILVCIFIFSAFHIIKITYGYKQANKINTELQAQFVTKSDTQIPISIDFDTLKEKNSDITGWIYCPDTPINYPIVQSNNNNQYLRTDLNGKYSVSGTIFADYRNKDLSDPNYIIYGHNMDDLSMFGTLKKYKKDGYFDAHPIIFLLTPEENYIIELFAGALVKKDSEIYKTDPPKDVINDIRNRSTFECNIEVADNDTIVTLSTCSYEFNDARYVLLGKLKTSLP